MRVTLVIAAVCSLTACGPQQSSIERAFSQGGDAARSAQAETDAQVILQGMDKARHRSETVARALNRNNPDAVPMPVTR
jgi:hypothetical protein